MRKLSGPQWLAKYRRKDEGHYEALERVRIETGLGLKTIYRALVHQFRISPESLEALERVAGEGRLDRESFLCAPTGQPKGPRGRRPKVPRVDDAAAKVG